MRRRIAVSLLPADSCDPDHDHRGGGGAAEAADRRGGCAAGSSLVDGCGGSEAEHLEPGGKDMRINAWPEPVVGRAPGLSTVRCDRDVAAGAGRRARGGGQGARTAASEAAKRFTSSLPSTSANASAPTGSLQWRPTRRRWQQVGNRSSWRNSSRISHPVTAIGMPGPGTPRRLRMHGTGRHTRGCRRLEEAAVDRGVPAVCSGDRRIGGGARGGRPGGTAEVTSTSPVYMETFVRAGSGGRAVAGGAVLVELGGALVPLPAYRSAVLTRLLDRAEGGQADRGGTASGDRSPEVTGCVRV